MNEPFQGSDEELDARARRIDLAHEPDFTVGIVSVQPSLRTISGRDGEAMLEPKVMQVLVALGTPQGAILSRDDLIERCWEGRVVGDTSINRVISLLRSGLKSVAGDAVVVENVPKVGYRLMATEAAAPVSEPESAPSAPEPAAEGAGNGSRKFVWVGMGLFAALAAIAAIVWLQPRAEPVLEPVKVALLPLSYDESVDPLYAKGLEGELRSQLARVGQIEVTASDSARQLFDEGLSADEICARLGADYAWVGALNVEADRVSFRARLIDASTKGTAFREEFTSAPDAAQYIPLRAARAISGALGRPVSGRLPESDVSASDYRLYLTALGLIKGRGIEQRIAALDILEGVTESSPDFADGWAGLAKAYFLYPARDGDREETIANRERALETARYALTLDPEAVDALKIAGMLEQDPAKRLELLGRATELDPGDAEAWLWLAITRSEFLLLGEDPIEAAYRMVQIDPLWPAAWRTSDLAAEFGDLDLAVQIERDILAAAVTPSQRLSAEARMARLSGDLSGFLELSRRAAQTQTAAERRYGAGVQVRMLRFLLGLPPLDEMVIAREAPLPLVRAVLGGELPSRAQMEAQGVTAERFWQSPTFATPAMALFLNTGREAELLALYDEAFTDYAAFVAFARGSGYPEQVIPSISPYIAFALRNAGREAEAAQHLRGAEEQLARWKEAEVTSILPVIWDLQLAAVKGEEPRAIAAVKRLPEYGWPYTMGHIDTLTLGLVRGDPLYDSIRGLPEVKAVLDPIRETLERERAEVLALGG